MKNGTLKIQRVSVADVILLCQFYRTSAGMTEALEYKQILCSVTALSLEFGKHNELFL